MERLFAVNSRPFFFPPLSVAQFSGVFPPFPCLTVANAFFLFLHLPGLRGQRLSNRLSFFFQRIELLSPPVACAKQFRATVVETIPLPPAFRCSAASLQAPGSIGLFYRSKTLSSQALANGDPRYRTLSKRGLALPLGFLPPFAFFWISPPPRNGTCA